MMVAALSPPTVAIPSSEPQSPSKSLQQKSRSVERTGNGGGQRRPRGKQVPSRYMSPSPSPSSSLTSSSNTTTSTSSSSSSSTTAMATLKGRRFPSPLISRTTNSSSNPTKTPSLLPKRSQSVDRRRPAVPTSGGELSNATKMLITSTRSLSVSFQGETFSLPISKKKETSTTPRKSTPERRRSTPVRDHAENSKPVDQQRWPGTTRKVNSGSGSNQFSRSLDCGGEKWKLGSGFLGKSMLHHSMIDEGPRVSVDGRLSLNLGSTDEFKAMEEETKRNSDVNLAKELASCVSCDLTASDTDSVSSGSTNGVQECGSGGNVNGEFSKGKSLSRTFLASPRFWQETNSRLRRLNDPGSPLSTSPNSRTGVSSKFGQSKRFSSDGPLASPRSMPSPIRGATRPASPSKLWASTASSPSRASLSPSRARNGAAEQMRVNNFNTPSILSFSADIRRGKIAEDRVMGAHLLRLLYNRYLQWRFANARADTTSMVQRLDAEKNLWNAWVSISELRHAVTLKRIKLMLLRQKLKLTSVLRGQLGYLEEWSVLDKDHSNSLLGATEALKASTLRLPIVGKAVVDIQDLKDAVGSAVDVMHAMASPICSLSMKVEEMDSLMAELMNINGQEKALLEQCKGFLSKVAAMQVTDCSLKTHIIQQS